MVREQKDGSRGAQSLNGNDAREILGIIFEWIHKPYAAAQPGELAALLRKAGYTPKMLEGRLNDGKQPGV